MRKPAFCICENKGADQLSSHRAADQLLCFCYIDSTIPLLPKFRNFKPLKPSSEVVQPGLRLVGNPEDRFSGKNGKDKLTSSSILPPDTAIIHTDS